MKETLGTLASGHFKNSFIMILHPQNLGVNTFVVELLVQEPGVILSRETIA